MYTGGGGSGEFHRVGKVHVLKTELVRITDEGARSRAVGERGAWLLLLRELSRSASPFGIGNELGDDMRPFLLPSDDVQSVRRNPNVSVGSWMTQH